MNLLEYYVTNITKEECCEKIVNNTKIMFYTIVADIDCYGNKEKQVTIKLTPSDYKSVKEHGYYFA